MVARDEVLLQRADVAPVLVAYIEMRVPPSARRELLIAEVVAQGAGRTTYLGHAYESAIALCLDLTSELVARQYAPFPRTAPDALYTELCAGVTRHTHELADHLNTVLWVLTSLRSHVEHEAGREPEQRRIAPAVIP